MARVEWGGHRRTEVNVAQAHHQITGVEYCALDLIEIRQVVDAADELQIARAPRRVLAHGGHVLFDRQLTRRVVPGQRQVDDARRYLQVLGGAHGIPFTGDDTEQIGEWQLLGLVVDLQ
ncbi:hypothetical protein D3C71_1064270 [compost metagenome]